MPYSDHVIPVKGYVTYCWIGDGTHFLSIEVFDVHALRKRVKYDLSIVKIYMNWTAIMSCVAPIPTTQQLKGR